MKDPEFLDRDQPDRLTWDPASPEEVVELLKRFARIGGSVQEGRRRR